jgi:hypothetical protein
MRRKDVQNETTLHNNPFFLLGATTRDDRRKIVALAEEKSFEIDHDVCQKARSDLTNPRIRLNLEMAWLPGVSPKKTTQLMEQLKQDPMSVRLESELPSLAHANLMAAAFDAVNDKFDLEDLSNFIQEMAYIVDDITVDEIIHNINEDRTVSGFPEISARNQVEAELSERKHYFKNVVKESINRLPSQSLVEVMILAVDTATMNGEEHAPELIDELVDAYEIETLDFLQKEVENVYKLIKKIRDFAPSGENVVTPLVEKLEVVASNWDKVAQPIQLNAKARGIEHEMSKELAYSLRNLCIDLFNEYDMLSHSQRITRLLQELFAELPEVVEKVEKDADALQEIFQKRTQYENKASEWAKEITYSVELGLIFKDILSISPDGISWKQKNYPLDTITRVRWGGVSQSSGTTYLLAFGDVNSEAIVELKKKDIYRIFVDKLWKAVCVGLITELLEALKVGQEIRFGNAIFRDDSVTLIRKKDWKTESIRYIWEQVDIWDANGSFYVGAKDNKNTHVQLSYIYTANTHILEQVIRMAFKQPGVVRRLSDVLNLA